MSAGLNFALVNDVRNPTRSRSRYCDAMARFSMMARVDSLAEVADAEAWIEQHRHAVTSISEGGCGCCVRYWRIDGPRHLSDTIPQALTMDDPDWEQDQSHGQ